MDINEKLRLANKIVENIIADFEKVHLSTNLMSTIEIRVVGNNVEIEIPADIYDVEKYLNEGVLIYTGEGSYASDVDTYGGFSGKHKDFLVRSAEQGTKQFYKERNTEVKVSLI